MNISMILCVYNRCESLAKALESVAASRLPESVACEVLVVDNNSSEQTRDVVEDFCRRPAGRFHYLFEPQPGKSHALSAGIRGAEGDILAFIDDDVTVEPEWLQSLTTALPNRQLTRTGERILPERTFSPPHWLPIDGPYALAPLAVFDLGPEARPLAEHPFGTNMAFRKEMFQKYGGFRPDLGPKPGREISNEAQTLVISCYT